jgi:hypothetical protein
MSFLQQPQNVNGTGTDWTQIGHRGHAVQFYEHDDALAEMLAAYIGTALVKGDAAIVIATRKHRDDLRSSLAERGLDLKAPESQGRYHSFDAAAMLADTSTPAGWPDRDRFRKLIGDSLTAAIRATGYSPRIAVFGEMAALLCAQGQFAAAIHLEELWNELARDYQFSLCCAYPMSLFKTDDAAAARFMKVCAQHSHVFPAERRSASSSRLRLGSVG